MRDPSVGTIIYDSPALSEFPHEGWCDLQFLDLIDSKEVMLLDENPGAKKQIIRAIDTYLGSRHKSFLSEWRVGNGSLLVSTLNMEDYVIDLPEARWLLQSLIHYGLSHEFTPDAVLPLEYVTNRISRSSNYPINTQQGFKYYYYEGNWLTVPDYFNLTPIDSGYVSQIRLDEIENTDRESFALLFYGSIKIEQEGNYTFYTASNDGSLLLVNNIRLWIIMVLMVCRKDQGVFI